ncbi:MAG: hypothetical protein AMXMBFR4_24760 [Candidatus Hydrogenedentota bacterium]
MKEVPSWVAGVLVLGIVAVFIYPPRYEVTSNSKGGIVRTFSGWHAIWKAPQQATGEDARPIRYEFHTTYITLEILVVALIALGIAALAGKRKVESVVSDPEQQAPPQPGP